MTRLSSFRNLSVAWRVGLAATLTLVILAGSGCAPEETKRQEKEATSSPTTQPGVAKRTLDPVSFCGIQAKADNVVYVIDRSGSMLDKFDAIRHDLLESINRLKAGQHFGVVFFAADSPMEMAPKRLLHATDENKAKAAGFLEGVRPQGQTDPIPALQRAFYVLNKANGNGKVMLLLTDGVFPDNEKVLQTIRKLNVKKSIIIYTILYGDQDPEAVEVMKQIARENGGTYKFISVE